MDDKRDNEQTFQYESGNRLLDLTDYSIRPATDNGFRFKKRAPVHYLPDGVAVRYLTKEEAVI